ncbi:MAG: transketolase family protein [Spirochaetes bacterium]|nr:transketolase family protein [Spirochaetota bacterium]
MKDNNPKQLRFTYGEALAELGENNPGIVVVDADMADGTRTIDFKRKFPERFYDVGIAEQNLVGVGVGLSLTGLIPFINTFAWLISWRAGDSVRTLVAYAKTNVKLVGGYGGFSGPMDGATHESIADISVMRSLPGLAVISASDHEQVKSILPVIADYDGPVYLRLSRAEVIDFHDSTQQFKLGRGILIKDGNDITLIGTGTIMSRVLKAASVLQSEGINAAVVEIPTIKPLDKELIITMAGKTGSPVPLLPARKTILSAVSVLPLQKYCQKIFPYLLSEQAYAIV